MVTQKDIADRLGLSRAAVSTVLTGKEIARKFRPEMRRRILQTAREMGYQQNELARSLRTGRTNVIGFISMSIDNEYSSIMLKGIAEEVQEDNYYVKVLSVGAGKNKKDAGKVAGMCIRQALGGVILYDVANYNFVMKLDSLLREHNIPMVIACGDINLKNGLRILSDTYQGGRIALEHLHSLGHRRLAYLYSRRKTRPDQQMLRGFSEAAEKNGIKIPKENIWTYPDHFDCAKVYEKYEKYHPTAIFCSTVYHALAVTTFFQREGIRIPEELSIISRGNMKFSRCCFPSLTVLDENLYDIGARAAAVLKEKIENGNGSVPLLEYYTHTLVVRESTGKCK